MGAGPIQGAERASTNQGAGRRPRIFLVQPQRLFLDAMVRFLTKDFEIVGVSEDILDIAYEDPLDLILIDSDSARLPDGFLANASASSGAVVCALLLHDGRGLRNWWVPSWVRVIPKYLTQQQFVEALLRLAPQNNALVSICAANEQP